MSVYAPVVIPNPLLRNGGAIQVATRGYFPTTFYSQAAAETAQTSRSYHKLQYDCSGLRLVYTNNWTDSTVDVGDTSIPGSITVKAMVEYNSQKFLVWFNGQRTATIGAGGQIISDPLNLNIDITVTQDFFVRTYVDAGATPVDVTKMWPRTLASNTTLGEGTAATDLTDLASGAVTAANNKALYGPSAIIGVAANINKPSILIVGDSLPYNNGDMPLVGATTYEGFVARACDTAGYPYLKICIPSERAKTYSETNLIHSQARNFFTQFCTHVIDDYGHNDIVNSDTLANLKIYAAARWKYYKSMGLKVFATTLTPQTTSTDKYVTTANQTAATGFTAGGIADQWNTFILAGGVANLDGVFDIRTTVQDVSAPTKWAAAASVYDGTVSSATTSTITVTGTPWTTDQLAQYVLVITGGASTGNAAKLVRTNTSNVLTIYSFTGGSNFSPTPSAADTFSIYPIMTLDGTHPSSWGHKTIAAAMNMSQLTR